MASPNLNITHIVSSQAQKEVTANEAFDALDAALCGQLSVDFTAGNVTLTNAQFRGSITFRATNLSVARDLTVPAIKRLFVVSNKDGTNTLTVKRGATSIAIASGKLALLYTDSTTAPSRRIAAQGRSPPSSAATARSSRRAATTPQRRSATAAAR